MHRASEFRCVLCNKGEPLRFEAACYIRQERMLGASGIPGEVRK